MKESKFFTKLGIKNIVFSFIVLGFLFYTISFSSLGNSKLGYLIVVFTYPILFGLDY